MSYRVETNNLERLILALTDACAKVALRATWKERARRLELGEVLSDLEPGAADADTDTDELSDTDPVAVTVCRAASVRAALAYSDR